MGQQATIPQGDEHLITLDQSCRFRQSVEALACILAASKPMIYFLLSIKAFVQLSFSFQISSVRRLFATAEYNQPKRTKHDEPARSAVWSGVSTVLYQSLLNHFLQFFSLWGPNADFVLMCGDEMIAL